MKTKSVQLSTLCFLALLVGFFSHASVSYAGDPVLVAYRYIHDDVTKGHLERYCGIWDDTSKACNNDYLECYRNFMAIDENLYDVCDERKDVCKYDVESITLPDEMADILYDIPVRNFANNGSIAKLNNCRVQHPKSEDAVVPVKTPDQIAEEDCRREEALRQERGEEPLRDCRQVALEAAQKPEAQVDTNDDAQIQVPENGGGENAAGENAAADNAGGCSLQSLNSPASTLHGVFAMLVALIPFATTAMARSRKK